MEVHSGQRQSTMAQAMAHNASTLDRDLDMLITVLVNRHGGVLLDSVRAAQDHIIVRTPVSWTSTASP
jgi:hypothetical protein